MKAHTPGPWIGVVTAYDKGLTWEVFSDEEAAAAAEANVDGLGVAILVDRPEERANMCLIVAAPHLLWAAREAMEFLEDIKAIEFPKLLSEVSEEDTSLTLLPEYERVIDGLKAAIDAALDLEAEFLSKTHEPSEGYQP